MSAQHTPGPWTASHIGEIRGSADRQTVAYVRGPSATSAADARLIAAAPDLLDMARKALAAWTGDGPPIDLDDLRAAIAKAEGRS
jgi:hypothetical protein